MRSLIKSAEQWTRQRKLVSQDDMCEVCGKNPKFVENGFQHPYCGRSCARGATRTNLNACALRGCRATGKVALSGFCSENHERDAVRNGQMKGCSHCTIRPQSVGELCTSCDHRLRALEPALKELDRGDDIFRSVESHFTTEWRSPDGFAGVDKIYEVLVPRDTRVRHSVFRKGLASTGPIQQIRTYHSTECICNLGTNGAVLCGNRSCGICSVVKSSFREFAFGVPYNDGRYGSGIYSYQNPARADRFATSCTSSPYRVMISCDAIVEAGQSPVSPNEKFPINEQSVFVASLDAITPEYIIVYHK